jgi:hypothetical protein
MSLIRGRMYNRMKKNVPNPEGIGGKSGKIVKGQNDTQQSTADDLSKKFHVSPSTVKRDGKLAEFLSKHPEQEKAVLNNEKRLSDVRREQKKIEVVQNLENIHTKETKAIEGLYDVIVVDPPWGISRISNMLNV